MSQSAKESGEQIKARVLQEWGQERPKIAAAAVANKPNAALALEIGDGLKDMSPERFLDLRDGVDFPNDPALHHISRGLDTAGAIVRRLVSDAIKAGRP